LEETLLTYEECMISKEKEKWCKAINEEMDSLEKKKTWEIINKDDVPDGKEILSSRWIMKVKGDGRYKARLVVRGCEQNQEFDSGLHITRNTTCGCS
jgi:hypothetical protein